MVSRAADVEKNEAEIQSGGRGERVLYVVSSFPCWSETFIVREIHTLLKRGADVRIVALRHKPEAFVQSDARALLDRVLYSPAWYRCAFAVLSRILTQPALTLGQPLNIISKLWQKPYVMAKSLVAWFRTLGVLDKVEQWEPDHIHAHWATYPSTSAMIMSKHTGRPFSFTAHAHDIYLDDQLMAEKLESAAFISTISRFNRDYLRSRYVQAAGARIEIVHCGVPRGPRLPREGTPRDEPLIVSVGRHDEVKGFPVLLQACRQLREGGVAFRCEIIGDGPLQKSLRRKIEEACLQNHVHLLGALPSQQVEEKLRAADLFVLASQRSREGNMDGIPVALMEAMASGVPVITTRVSGIPELVEDRVTGLLVPSADAFALAQAMRQMLNDETLQARCTENARRKVQNEFDAETEGGKLHGIIRSINTVTGGERHAEAIADHHG